MRNNLSASRILEQVQLLERQFTASRQNETGGKFILPLGIAVDFFHRALGEVEESTGQGKKNRQQR
jgi:hypothetical protein